MDKISGILPAGRRFRNVDTSGSQPVRPGAPSFGRPIGRISSAETLSGITPTSEMTPVDKVIISPNAKLLANDDVGVKEGFETVRGATSKEDEPSTYSGPRPVSANKVEALANRFFAPQKNEMSERIVIPKRAQVDAIAEVSEKMREPKQATNLLDSPFAVNESVEMMSPSPRSAPGLDS